jgi:membrane protease YdiL (CAAX protease family)
MSLSSVQADTAGSSTVLEPVDRFRDHGSVKPRRLAIETILVTAGVFVAARMLLRHSGTGYQWLLVPALLVAAALIPTWISRRDFARIGLHRDDAMRSARILSVVFLCMLPPLLLGLRIAAHFDLPVPLRPSVAGQRGWLAWLLYQFLYVAVAEEVFFRGYVQTNVARVLATRPWRSRAVGEGVVLLLSAACFAVAHALVQGRVLSLLTFFPGLLLAWLFSRTRVLLTPILFHGLANVAYGLLTLVLP